MRKCNPGILELGGLWIISFNSAREQGLRLRGCGLYKLTLLVNVLSKRNLGDRESVPQASQEGKLPSVQSVTLVAEFLSSCTLRSDGRSWSDGAGVWGWCLFSRNMPCWLLNILSSLYAFQGYWHQSLHLLKRGSGDSWPPSC